MHKIFIVEFVERSVAEHPTVTGAQSSITRGLIYKRMECVNCGRDMVDDRGLLDVRQHVCPIDKRTVGVRDWRTIARDAFLDDRDAEAIAIIAEMEPQRFPGNDELRDALAETRKALAEAIAQVEQHNSEYQHRTPPFEIERWKKNLK